MTSTATGTRRMRSPCEAERTSYSEGESPATPSAAACARAAATASAPRIAGTAEMAAFESGLPDRRLARNCTVRPSGAITCVVAR